MANATDIQGRLEHTEPLPGTVGIGRGLGRGVRLKGEVKEVTLRRE